LEVPSPIFGPDAKNATPKWSGVFAVLRWSLASQIMWWTTAFPVVPTADCPGRLFPFFRAAFIADALAGRLLFFGLAGRYSSSRYITGTLVVAIRMPFSTRFCFNNLSNRRHSDCLHSWNSDGIEF
jgi:hypothetical protein